MLIDSLATGGAERVAVDIACGLDPQRFAPHVVVTRSGGPMEADLAAAGVPLSILNRRGRYSPGAFRHAVRLAHTSDLIHAHKFGSNLWGAVLARRAGIPLVAHEHNWAGASTPFRSLCNRRWIAGAASQVLCVSSSVARALLADGVTPERLRVIENGVRVQEALPREAARAELGLSCSDFVVGIVAQLRVEKNHELLLRAMAQLQRAGEDVTLCIVGHGSRLSYLRDQAALLGVERRVVWATEHDRAHRLASAFDAAVLSSQWEGLPLAALEAMAAGVPVVATAVGGLPDLLQGGAGVLVPPGDAEAMAGAIAGLVGDRVRAESIGRVGRDRVHRHHDLASMVAEVENVYIEVLRADGIPGPTPEPLPNGPAR